MNIVSDTELSLELGQKFWTAFSFAIRLVQLRKSMMYAVVLVELVEALDEFPENRLTISDQQVEELLVLLHIVGHLARNAIDIVWL